MGFFAVCCGVWGEFCRRAWDRVEIGVDGVLWQRVGVCFVIDGGGVGLLFVAGGGSEFVCEVVG